MADLSRRDAVRLATVAGAGMLGASLVRSAQAESSTGNESSSATRALARFGSEGTFRTIQRAVRLISVTAKFQTHADDKASETAVNISVRKENGTVVASIENILGTFSANTMSSVYGLEIKEPIEYEELKDCFAKLEIAPVDDDTWSCTFYLEFIFANANSGFAWTDLVLDQNNPKLYFTLG